MEVKEAIEFVNEIFNDWENIYCTSTGVNIEANKKLKQVIEFLKRGEKYEAILHEREIDCPKDFTEKVMEKINKKRGKNV